MGQGALAARQTSVCFWECWQWLPPPYLDHTSGLPVCLYVVRPCFFPGLVGPDPALFCGVEWAGLGCSPHSDWGVWAGGSFQCKALFAWLLARQHEYAPREWSLGFSSPSVCPSSRGGYSPPHWTLGLEIPDCDSICLLPRMRVCPCGPSFQIPPRDTGPDPVPFFCPTWLHGDHPWSFHCIGVLLPVSS